jgi:hypothetical protein
MRLARILSPRGGRDMKLQRQSTLLELIRVVSESARNDDEVVATVAYLINSGSVRLCGTFAGAKIAVRPSLRGMKTNPGGYVSS